MDTLAILVGGGPAPGINGVIASATIEAINSGLRVVGLYDGIATRQRRHLQGASSSRSKRCRASIPPAVRSCAPRARTRRRTKPPSSAASRSLRQLGVRYLVCIGGDDTTYGAAEIAERTRGRIGVATVPKTIDNDLPLPDNAPTFGFETARSVGAGIVESLMEDARTTARWYIVICMGRKSGFAGAGHVQGSRRNAGGIPEEFPATRSTLALVVDTIVGSIVKRRALGHDHGVAVVAEGIAERIGTTSIDTSNILGATRTATCGWPTCRWASVLRDAVRERLERMGVDMPSCTPRTSATSCAAPNRSHSTSNTRARSATVPSRYLSTAAAAR